MYIYRRSRGPLGTRVSFIPHVQFWQHVQFWILYGKHRSTPPFHYIIFSRVKLSRALQWSFFSFCMGCFFDFHTAACAQVCANPREFFRSILNYTCRKTQGRWQSTVLTLRVLYLFFLNDFFFGLYFVYCVDWVLNSDRICFSLVSAQHNLKFWPWIINNVKVRHVSAWTITCLAL